MTTLIWSVFAFVERLSMGIEKSELITDWLTHLKKLPYCCNRRRITQQLQHIFPVKKKHSSNVIKRKKNWSILPMFFCKKKNWINAWDCRSPVRAFISHLPSLSYICIYKNIFNIFQNRQIFKYTNIKPSVHFYVCTNILHNSKYIDVYIFKYQTPCTFLCIYTIIFNIIQNIQIYKYLQYNSKYTNI